MAVFPLLAEPRAYRACDWDFVRDDEGRAYYLSLFEEMFPTVASAAVASGHDPAALEAARVVLVQWLHRLHDDPKCLGGRLDILTLDELHTRILLDHGVVDAFKAIKARETAQAMALLPARLDEIDAMRREERTLELIRGVFAGNVFDMGAKHTAARFSAAGRPAFDVCLSEVRPRPWLVDDLDWMRFDRRAKAVVFVDNAGGDIALGMLPLLRELVGNGVETVAVANTRPAWNDVTLDELRPLVRAVPELEVAERDGRLRLVGSGTGAPLIDLSEVSEELCDAATDADLVVLEGMGRAVESNWDARLTCEVWRLATLKDPMIAARKGGTMCDCICRVDAAP